MELDIAFKSFRGQLYKAVISHIKPQVNSFIDGKTCYQPMLVNNMCPNRTNPLGCKNMILIILH